MNAVTEVRTGDELRARRRRKMAEEIELAALRLFAERGIDAVTVDDIAAAADISRRTFFRYFASKDQLLRGNPERYGDIVLTTIDNAPSSHPVPTLVRDALLALVDEYSNRREAHQLRIRIAANSPAAFAGNRSMPDLHETIVEAVAARTGQPHADLALRTYVHAGLGAAQAAARTWFTASTNHSLHELTAQALDLINLREPSAPSQ